MVIKLSECLLLRQENTMCNLLFSNCLHNCSVDRHPVLQPLCLTAMGLEAGAELLVPLQVVLRI